MNAEERRKKILNLALAAEVKVAMGATNVTVVHVSAFLLGIELAHRHPEAVGFFREALMTSSDGSRMDEVTRAEIERHVDRLVGVI